MLKFIVFELLKCYITREKKCYSHYVANIFAIACFVMLITINYFYFYLEDRDIGSFIICGTAFLSLALIAKIYSCYFKPKVGDALPSLIADGAGKIVPYLPTLIRFVPIGVITFTTWNLIKGKLAARLKN